VFSTSPGSGRKRARRERRSEGGGSSSSDSACPYASVGLGRPYDDPAQAGTFSSDNSGRRLIEQHCRHRGCEGRPRPRHVSCRLLLAAAGGAARPGRRGQCQGHTQQQPLGQLSGGQTHC